MHHNVFDRMRSQRESFLLLVVLASLFLSLTSALQAAPMTLQFEATVGAPRQGVDDFVPPEWGFTLAPGETVSGTFTFEPLDVPTNVHTTSVVEPMQYALYIKSQTLTTSQFGINVSDDSNPIDSNGPYDSISFGCSFGANGAVCSPSTVASGGSLLLSMQTSLYGDPSTLNGADIPSDPNVWQQFMADNTMLVSMVDPVNFRFYGFLATVVSFRAVPEPSALFSFAFQGILTILIARTRISHK